MDFRITDISSMSDDAVIAWGAMPTRGSGGPGARKGKNKKKKPQAAKKRRKTKPAKKKKK